MGRAFGVVVGETIIVVAASRGFVWAAMLVVVWSCGVAFIPILLHTHNPSPTRTKNILKFHSLTYTFAFPISIDYQTPKVTRRSLGIRKGRGLSGIYQQKSVRDIVS